MPKAACTRLLGIPAAAPAAGSPAAGRRTASSPPPWAALPRCRRPQGPGAPSLAERLMARGRQSRHPCLDDQGSGGVDGRAQQHIRQGRADAARQGAPGWPQQISAQQHHRVPQVHVAAGGGRHLHHHSGHAGQRRKGRRHHAPSVSAGRSLAVSCSAVFSISSSPSGGAVSRPDLLLPS